MYRIEVNTTFSAAHALMIRGSREPVHGHDWNVTVTLVGPTLDPDGLLCDFHAVEAALAEITAPFRNADLNSTPFETVNPSAEHVAKHITDELVGRLTGLDASGDAPASARVDSVSVTEAPGCRAIYHPETDA